MTQKRIVQIGFVDEDEELRLLMKSLKTAWDNYEHYLNRLEDDEQLLEEWTFKTIVQKQLYRYIYRLVKELYERKDFDDKPMDPPRGNPRFYFAR